MREAKDVTVEWQALVRVFDSQHGLLPCSVHTANGT